MALYLFEHPETKETVEVFQRVNEEHVYLDKDGVRWVRVFTAPNVSKDTQIDPFSEKDFSTKMGQKKGSVGDLMDASREASEKREKTLGKDPVKQGFFDKWSKARKGRKHPNSYEG